MPALASLNKEQQRAEMRRVALGTTPSARFSEYVAHCSSFKELQFMASERKKYHARDRSQRTAHSKDMDLHQCLSSVPYRNESRSLKCKPDVLLKYLQQKV
jgi:hypothetical protein